MNRQAPYYFTLAAGIIIGILIAIVAVMAKDEIRFHANCDGTVVSTWTGADYCVDPSVLDK